MMKRSMKIGVFDSGVGGLVIFSELEKQFPEFDFLYFGDNARAPYGTRSAEEVYAFTLQAVEYLFAQGCVLVILACNTASANALRKIQQDTLPKKYPDKHVLGILVPTVEQISLGNVLVFATPGTVRSGAYETEIKKRNPAVQVFSVACQNLASMIEMGESEVALAREVAGCVENAKRLMGEAFPPDTVLLGCTHYPLIHHLFAAALPSRVPIYDQAKMVAESLRTYLRKHPEIASQIHKGGGRDFLTTAAPESVEQVARKFYDKPVLFTRVSLP